MNEASLSAALTTASRGYMPLAVLMLDFASELWNERPRIHMPPNSEDLVIRHPQSPAQEHNHRFLTVSYSEIGVVHLISAVRLPVPLGISPPLLYRFVYCLPVDRMM